VKYLHIPNIISKLMQILIRPRIEVINFMVMQFNKSRIDNYLNRDEIRNIRHKYYRNGRVFSEDVFLAICSEKRTLKSFHFQSFTTLYNSSVTKIKYEIKNLDYFSTTAHHYYELTNIAGV
jgi:hypothetical protein